jgi:hypothetical protein
LIAEAEVGAKAEGYVIIWGATNVKDVWAGEHGLVEVR